MFDHVDLPVRDLQASAAFYRVVLAPLGIEQAAADAAEFGALSLVERVPRERVHLAFVAESVAEVDAFYKAGVTSGYRSNGEPGLRSYADDYYAAYLLDPDGHNVEAVHRSPETRRRWTWLGRGVISS